MKAVIIDDEVWSRKMIRSLGRWEELGITIVGEAEDGIAGWELIAAERPDIVLLDMRMPGMEGTELIRRLNERGIDAKVIVISGHADFQYTKHAIDYKASTYILKPIDEDELNDALANCAREVRKRDALRNDELLTVHYENKELTELTSRAKRELGRYLQAVDAHAADQAFRKLREELSGLGAGEAGVRKVYVELYLLLEEYLAPSGISIQELAERTLRTDADAEPDESLRRLGDLYLTAIERESDRRKPKDKLDLEEVRKYIDRHYDEPISLETVADAFYVSKEYLSKAFKAKFGGNLTDYVIGLRMGKAKELVCSSDLKIKSIAQAVGYEDVTYFNRLFKSHYGETPGGMRDRMSVAH